MQGKRLSLQTVTHPPRPLGWCQKVKISFFLKVLSTGHDAYQIKENEVYNNMQGNIVPLNTPSTPGVGSKGQISKWGGGGKYSMNLPLKEKVKKEMKG